jgi:hypothetical protein
MRLLSLVALLAVPCVAQEPPHEKLSGADWASIRAAWDAGRHQVLAVEGGHRARNPGQRWTTHFDGRGATTTPDGGGWSWGLELVRYGWGGDTHDVARPRSVTAEGGRVVYAWDEALTEWYVNDQRGLEHGFTVHARPAGARGALEVALAVRGGLVAVVSQDGRDVVFVGDAGGTVLTYAGLAVLDAEGKALAACWEWQGGALRVGVNDRGARYPLTIDPIAQQAYLKASNTGAYTWFGESVAVSGDTVVVGARWEASSATGVNGNQSDNSAWGAGAAYVFVRNGTTWSQQAYLKASNTGALDQFGYSVAVSGDTIVVGAYSEDSNATGVNGDQGNDNAPDSGAAYVFVRSGTTWSQQAYLKASNTGADDRFGVEVAVSGDTIVVGALQEASNATGVNGDQSNNGTTWAGAAYVFVRSGTTWSQQAYLKASNTGLFDRFGESVAVSGDTIVVGARFEASNATGVNGDQSNNGATGAGAAYVFVRSGTTWSQQAYLKASNTGMLDLFGFVSVSGDTVVVGAAQEASNATGVNGDQSNDNAPDSGAAYVFVRSGTSWSQQAYLKASNTDAGDEFGYSVSVSGDAVVVGAWREDSNAKGINGDQSDNSFGEAGAAYVFTRVCGTGWSQQAYLKASNTGADDRFGESVAVSGDTIVVGAFWEDSSATGVNGDQTDNSAREAGAAYVFTVPPPTTGRFVPWGGGCLGSNGLSPVHAASVNGGTPERGETIRYTAANAAPGSATLFLGFSDRVWNGLPLPFPLLFIGGGDFCNILVEGFFTLPFVVDGSGSGFRDVPTSCNLPIGTRFYTQTWHIDLGVPSPLKITVGNALRTELGG